MCRMYWNRAYVWDVCAIRCDLFIKNPEEKFENGKKAWEKEKEEEEKVDEKNYNQQ